MLLFTQNLGASLATSILYPNGDGTHTGTIGGTSGPPYYTNVDEGTDSPNDSDAVIFSSSGAIFACDLTDTPADTNTITAVAIKVRTADSSKGRAITSARIYQSDQTTALTAAATITGSTTITTYTLNPSITGATTKTAWDGARLLITATGSSGSANLYAAQVEITYTTASGTVQTASFMIGT